eukprot:1385765-Amorphochlora_amoeboformis.AAC.1
MATLPSSTSQIPPLPSPSAKVSGLSASVPGPPFCDGKAHDIPRNWHDIVVADEFDDGDDDVDGQVHAPADEAVHHAVDHAVELVYVPFDVGGQVDEDGEGEDDDSHESFGFDSSESSDDDHHGHHSHGPGHQPDQPDHGIGQCQLDQHDFRAHPHDALDVDGDADESPDENPDDADPDDADPDDADPDNDDPDDADPDDDDPDDEDPDDEDPDVNPEDAPHDDPDDGPDGDPDYDPLDKPHDVDHDPDDGPHHHPYDEPDDQVPLSDYNDDDAGVKYMGTTTTLFPMLESMSVLNFEAGELWVKIGTASKSGVSLARYLALCFSRGWTVLESLSALG